MRLLKLPLHCGNQILASSSPLPVRQELHRRRQYLNAVVSPCTSILSENVVFNPTLYSASPSRVLQPPLSLFSSLFLTAHNLPRLLHCSSLICRRRPHAVARHPPMNRSQSQVGVLVPLNDKLVEDVSVPEVMIYEGDNVIGRGNIPLSDKRLSRKQLTLSASIDGTAEMVAEGTNPVVVHMGNERKKLSLGEKVCVTNGDVIELIPGQYFFKLVRNEKHSVAKKDLGGLGVKRAEREPNEEAVAATSSQARSRAERSPQQEIDSHSKRQKVSGSRNTKEAIPHFQVSNDKLPMTFRLMRVQGLPPHMNTSCVSIGDVIQGNVLVAVLSNYMVDIDWLLSACPKLKKVPHVLVIHGEADGTLEYMKKHKPANWILHKPSLPISYGTHHSKAMLLVYPRGVRVIVHTANLIYVDWNNKSQGLWMQDFPWKCPSDSGGSCGFESDLIDYLNALKLPEMAASLPALGNVKINSSFFKKFNYGNAMVRLIASVPGYHSGPNLKKWGHMKLRSILEQCVFDKEFKKAPLVYQFSSLGSLDEKWMVELKSSMSAGSSDDKSSLGIGEPLIIWPTVEDVRCSIEGYGAGNAIPSPLKNVEKAFLKKYLAKWKASHTGRCRAMPHIKTFTRFSGQNLAWFLLTSANLSKAAWGALQKNNTQLMIRSYELGILFLPSSIKNGCGFSCTDEDTQKDKNGSMENPVNKKTKLVTLNWQSSGNTDPSTEIIQLPVPYELPPPLYSPEDVPWSWDRQYTKKDVYGEVWPRRVKLYACQD